MELRLMGRASKDVTAAITRELGEEDLAWIQEERATPPNPVKALRERHHHLARLLAEGATEAQASAITEYTLSRISVLKADHSFQQLIEYYRGQVVEKYLGVHEKMSAASSTALSIILDRMEEDPEKVSLNQAIEIAKMGADRTGHGPSSTQQVNVNVGFAEKLEAARRRVASRTLDLTPIKED